MRSTNKNPAATNRRSSSVRSSGGRSGSVGSDGAKLKRMSGKLGNDALTEKIGGAAQVRDELLARILERLQSVSKVQEIERDAIKNQRAAKELVTGKFYHHRKEFLAALTRYQNVVSEFPDSTYVEEALYRIIEVYVSLGLTQEARNTAVLLGHNFPASTWYYKAYEIVEGPLPRHIRSKGGGLGRLNPFG